MISIRFLSLGTLLLSLIILAEGTADTLPAAEADGSPDSLLDKLAVVRVGTTQQEEDNELQLDLLDPSASSRFSQQQQQQQHKVVPGKERRRKRKQKPADRERNIQERSSEPHQVSAHDLGKSFSI